MKKDQPIKSHMAQGHVQKRVSQTQTHHKFLSYSDEFGWAELG